MIWQDYLLLLLVGGATLIYYLKQRRKPKRALFKASLAPMVVLGLIMLYTLTF